MYYYNYSVIVLLKKLHDGCKHRFINDLVSTHEIKFLAKQKF